MPIANGFKKSISQKEFTFNMKVIFGKKFSLFQLVNFPKPEKMFGKNYPFYTSSSKFMVNHFKKYSEWLKKLLKKKKFNVCELGSNDGTFLKNFNQNYSIGFEPSKSVHSVAVKKGINSINKFFNNKNIKSLPKKFQKYDVIIGSNVFCHIPDQVNLIRTIKNSLTNNGYIIFEEPYLGSMYKKSSYDQIYDEHIYMFSVHSVSKLYKKFNFDLIDAIPQTTHGGSMRYILRHSNLKKKKSKRLRKIFQTEKDEQINSIEGFKSFKKKIEKSKIKLKKKINKIINNGEQICGYGATSKSTTILNYCQINNKMIKCIFDTTKDKIGKYTPGTNIPIYDYKFFKKSGFKNVFLFAWNHKKEIMKKEKKLKNIKWFSHIN